ncbi:MAG: hypothetical protein R2712_13615 [Vicinamibacterales bacterium]
MRHHRTTRALVLGLILGLITPAAVLAARGDEPGRGDTVTRDEIASVVAELARLRGEVDALRGELRRLRDGRERADGVAVTPGPAAAAAASQPQPVDPGLDMLRTQVEELAQTRVETQSRMPVRLFGAIVSNTVVNSGDANWLENPNIVGAGAAGVQEGSMTSTLRQSRIGLNVGPIPLGTATVHGTVVADFMGGTPGFVTGSVMGLPRLVYAFARIEGERTALQIGQDHDLLAPRDPTSLAAQTFPLLFRAGNLYLRSPQVRVEHRVGRLTLKGGIAAPVAGDANSFYTFAPPAGEGERSRRPAVESRIDYSAGTAESAGEFSVGVSGRHGWRTPRAETVSTTSYAVDFNARWGRLGAAGEWFRTDDAAEFGAAVAQAWPAHGGWLEGRLALTSRLSANVGVGIDRVRDPVPAGSRQENRSAFGNVVFDLTPEVAMAMEYRWLETTLGRSLARRDNHHVNATFVVRF